MEGEGVEEGDAEDFPDPEYVGELVGELEILGEREVVGVRDGVTETDLDRVGLADTEIVREGDGDPVALRVIPFA